MPHSHARRIISGCGETSSFSSSVRIRSALTRASDGASCIAASFVAGSRLYPSFAQKRTARYKKLKGAAETIGKIPFLRGPAAAFEDKIRRKYGSADYNRLDEEMRKTFVKVISLDLTDRYEKIRQSTLLIWGDQDTETPIWMGREMEKRIPDSALILFENGTHFAYLEQIARFNVIAAEFLREG